MLEIWQNGDAGAMLFYPGSLLEPAHYIVFLGALYQAGFTVAALHLAGHGKNRGNRDFTFATLLAQGLAGEAWLRSRGFAPLAVAGHSQGGILATAHAAASRGLTAAFALGSVFPLSEEAIQLTRFAAVASRRDEILRLMARLARLFPRLPVPLPAYLDLGKIISGRTRPVALGQGRGRLAYPLRFLLSLFTARVPASLNCPFWLFAAPDDALFTKAVTEKTFRRAQAPRKTLAWLPHGGHMAPFNPYLAGYIARHCASACAGLGFPLRLGIREETCAMTD